MKTRALILPLTLAAGCAPRFDPKLVDAPIEGRRWVSTENRDHPLVGRIWDPRAARFVDEATLAAAVASADFVLLGETHDNPDHHLLQARLIRAITAAERRPALAFEMLTTDQQPAVDAALARTPKDPDAIGKAVRWDRSGWPDFELYRPIFAAGLEAGLPIVAAFLPRDVAKAIARKGRDALDEGLRERLARDEPLPADVLEEMREEMNASHCGVLPASLLDPLVLAQRARDARMEERMLAVGEGRGAILITGRGHARNTRGVPALLAKDAPEKKVVSVGFVEVDAGATEPSAYHEDGGMGPLAHDFVVFTPGAKRDDPCEGMKEHMERKRATPEKAKKGEAGGGRESAAPDEASAAPGAAKPAAP